MPLRSLAAFACRAAHTRRHAQLCEDFDRGFRLLGTIGEVEIAWYCWAWLPSPAARTPWGTTKTACFGALPNPCLIPWAARKACTGSTPDGDQYGHPDTQGVRGALARSPRTPQPHHSNMQSAMPTGQWKCVPRPDETRSVRSRCRTTRIYHRKQQYERVQRRSIRFRISVRVMRRF